MNAGWLGTRTTSKRTEHRRGRKRRRKPKQGIRGVSREYREESQSLQGLSRKESAAFPAWVNRLRKKWLGSSFRAERGISLWRKPKKRGIHRTNGVRCKTVPHFADSVRNDGVVFFSTSCETASSREPFLRCFLSFSLRLAFYSSQPGCGSGGRLFTNVNPKSSCGLPQSGGIAGKGLTSRTARNAVSVSLLSANTCARKVSSSCTLPSG